MVFTAELMLGILASIASGIGVYAAIKTDLATTRERATNALDSAKAAHDRINVISERPHSVREKLSIY